MLSEARLLASRRALRRSIARPVRTAARAGALSEVGSFRHEEVLCRVCTCVKQQSSMVRSRARTPSRRGPTQVSKKTSVKSERPSLWEVNG